MQGILVDHLRVADAKRGEIRARRSGSCPIGAAASAFIRPEVVALERDGAQLPASCLKFGARVHSLLFDGANSAVLLREERCGVEFRVALPQTGRFADIKPGEQVFFGFDPQQAICFAGEQSRAHA